ncbi:unnamed protein product [Moneuplotes crassus]|uniref:Uncharacterized protein n=1 Tax=Euplotes crassus TaxID=5936 RepID=A0AAD1Y1P3_EUPCR|nr:unnamed protein product [Moneuplotes crassus]
MKFVVFALLIIALTLTQFTVAKSTRTIQGFLEKSAGTPQYLVKSGGHSTEYYRPRSRDYHVKPVYDELKANSDVIKTQRYEKAAEKKVEKSMSFQSSAIEPTKVGKSDVKLELKDPNHSFTAKYGSISSMF